MEFQSVLVESIDTNRNAVYGNSGIMLNDGYIITTCNVLAPFYGYFEPENKYQEESRGIRLSHNDPKLKKNISFFITSENESSFNSQKAQLLGQVFSYNIRQSVKYIFRNWSIDSKDNNNNFNLLCVFVILKLENSKRCLRNDIDLWYDGIFKTTLIKGQNLKCTSAAFGNRNFLNHYSEGILSNILGKDNCLVFSDIPLTPGSEGSPVFCDSLCKFPIGIVISVVNWWKNEWLNFTVIADLRPLLLEIIESAKSVELGTHLNSGYSKLLTTVESCLFQVYNGTIWGTAILIDREKGIFITNAHVVNDRGNNILYRKNQSYHCDVVYSSPRNCPIDVAVLKTKSKLHGDCQRIYFSKRTLRCGDAVYAAGFPIFSKETNTNATLTKGHISHLHPQMIKTTCSIYPGASGGAIIDEEGSLIAVIVCNAKTSGPVNMVYPRANMNIPISLLEPYIRNYFETADVDHLKNITSIDAKIWNFSSKL